jgi:hypothetical protein
MRCLRIRRAPTAGSSLMQGFLRTMLKPGPSGGIVFVGPRLAERSFALPLTLVGEPNDHRHIGRAGAENPHHANLS